MSERPCREPRACVRCGKEFIPHHGAVKYCSPTHRRSSLTAAYRARETGRIADERYNQSEKRRLSRINYELRRGYARKRLIQLEVSRERTIRELARAREELACLTSLG